MLRPVVWLRCLILFALLALVAPARADPPAHVDRDDAPPVVMRMEFTRARGCPPGEEFENQLGARIPMWEPFSPDGPYRLVLVTRRAKGGYEGNAALYNAAGVVEWTASFPPTARCVDLLAEFAVALRIEIQKPLVCPPAPPAAAPTISPKPPPPMSCPETPSQPATPPPRVPIAFQFGASGWMNLGTAPRPALGMTVDAGVRVGRFSLAAQARWDPPAAHAVMSGVDMSTSRIAGALVPCLHADLRVDLAGCTIVELGAIEGAVTTKGFAPERSTALFAAIGGRFRIEVPLPRHLYLQGAVDLLGVALRPILPWALRATTTPGWVASRVSSGVGVGLGARF